MVEQVPFWNRGQLLILVCCVLCAGCNRMVVGLIGIHPYDRDVTPAKIDRLAHRMGISGSEDLALTQRYSYHLEERRGKMPEKNWKALHQPLQLRWYSKGGRMQWLVPNCDVGGFPNLQWQHFGLPDTLYVLPESRAYADSAWTIRDDLGFMVDRGSGQDVAPREGLRGHLLVYWAYFMGRQSVRLARYVGKWRKRHGDGIDVRYVNADSLMMGVDKPEVGR